VVNSAFEYYGYDRQIAKLAGRLGVYVLDARTGQSFQVTRRQGYHPFWLNRSTVGWGHSKYEDGEPGVFMARASRQARARRIGRLEGIHRTLPGSDGRILAYVGFPEYKKWTWIDPDGGRGAPAAAFEGMSSWEMPRKGVRDQCLQQAGGARIEEHAEHGYVVVTGTGSWVPGDMPLFTFREGYGQTQVGKPVRPCLSPDGKWIAYLGNPGGTTSYELQIAALPQ
jgi:hypothetical protein